MWPFKRKKKVDLWADMITSFENGIRDLEAFRKVGETFTYLGRTCVVTSLGECIPGQYPYALPTVVARLAANYADNQGRIHEITFAWDQLPTLIAMNECKYELVENVDGTQSLKRK